MSLRTAAVFALILCCVFPAGAETFRFRADRMTGAKATGKEITILEGNAEVVSADLLLRADRIELSGAKNRFVECFGRVSGVDDVKGIRFATERLRYDRELKIARLEGDSVLEDKENSVVAKGRFIDYDDGTGISVLQVGVRIFKDELICRSQYALYKRKEKTLDLSGFPQVFKDGDEFRADRMRVDLETDDVVMEGSVSGSLQQEAADAQPGNP